MSDPGYRTLDPENDVVVAILAKDKAPVLPLYLECLFRQTFPKDRIHLYVRANDSSDATVDLLSEWVGRHGQLYKSVTADYSDIGGLRHYRNHEWDPHRFSVLGRIRQASVDHARRLGCHYFVADLDNFVIPETLERLVESRLPVVAPLIRAVHTDFINFCTHTDSVGHLLYYPENYELLHGKVRGFAIANVIHCVYLVRNEFLGRVRYEDGTGRNEFVIFSETLRTECVPQYLDNRRIYGLMGFLTGDSENLNEFDHEGFHARILNLADAEITVLNDGKAFTD